MNYKRLGDYIKLVDERNSDLKIKLLLGLSINKIFIPSVANIIGSDMANYKIIRKNQFACSLMQVRRDKKMPLALLKDFEEAIISQAYPIFEIIDTKILNPEYLMMWFSRAEFDRQACFLAVGGVRGSLEWEDFCNMQLPIPTIEKQLEIVKEYNTIVNRIKLNENLIQKLEETAQAIYKNWFVDFEFPNENGKPYKSNGGEMIESELGEIPNGWIISGIDEISDIKAGGDKPKIYSENKTKTCSVPIFSNGVSNEGLYGYTNKANYPKNSITISARGTIGYCVLRIEPFEAIVRLIVVIPKFTYLSIYFWFKIKSIEFDNSGSVQNQLTIPQLSTLKMILPTSEVLEKFSSILSIMIEKIELVKKENYKLIDFKNILLSKLATIEN